MCMQAACVTKDFGVLATDSAQFDTSQSKMSFSTIKLYHSPQYLISFIGTPVFLAKLDKTKLSADLPTMSVYMKGYLNDMVPEVTKVLKSAIADEDENKPHFCMFLLGVHKKLPTLVQFNSFLKFEPKYLYSKDGPKFSTIYYGDDNPEKKKMFLESKAYMEKRMEKYKDVDLTPGLVGEVLARGIYKKADLEMKIGLKKKYAGGIVNAAGVWANGQGFSLSGTTGA